MNTKNTFGIGFYLRRLKEKNGKAPIYVRITVDGKRVDLSTRLAVELDSWNYGKGMAKGKTDEIKILNSYLEQIRARIVECYQELHLKNTLVTAEEIRNKYCGTEEKGYTVLNLFEYHNTEMKNKIESSTLKHYYTTQRYMSMYLHDELKVSDYFLSQLKFSFLIGFERYMRNYQKLDHQKPCGHNTALKHISRLRKLIRVAINNEWLEKDPFKQFKATFNKSTRMYLDAEELGRIEQKEFFLPRLQYAKDLFVFSCYTGLAYIDCFNLTPQNIIKSIDGELWISTARIKTQIPVRVPLLPKALEIIEKYKEHPIVVARNKLLPTYSNQKLNSYLKEIADFCKIEKPLTFHVARHTFATTVTLTNGVPIETVSKMLGHTNIRTTQIYAKVVEKKVGDDMKLLKEKLETIRHNPVGKYGA